MSEYIHIGKLVATFGFKGELILTHGLGKKTNLKDVEVLFVEGKPATLELPASVSLRVTESAEGVRGDSANNVQKPATLETGKIVTVPLFIKEGELVKIDTRTGNYMGRA